MYIAYLDAYLLTPHDAFNHDITNMTQDNPKLTDGDIFSIYMKIPDRFSAFSITVRSATSDTRPSIGTDRLPNNLNQHLVW